MDTGRLSVRLTAMCLAALTITAVLTGCGAAVVGGAAVTGAAVMHDRRDAGTMTGDQRLRMQARSAIRADDGLRTEARVRLTSYNGVILLVGEAPTEALKRRAAALVSDLDGVRAIHNEITVETPRTGLGTDTWTTAQVKSSLTTVDGVSGFAPGRVKVLTDKGTVYLMGLVTRDEAAAITERVRRIGGVQRVVRIFEYLDKPAPTEAAANAAAASSGASR